MSAGIDPFLAEAARRAEIPCYLDRVEDGPSDSDVVAGAVAANIGGDANDVVRLALRATI